MNIRDKLRWFDTDFARFRPHPAAVQGADVDTVMPGSEVTTSFGPCFLVRTVYPENYRHGVSTLDALAEIAPAVFGRVGRDEALSGLDLKKAVFLDTETTGLAGGSGTVPFLVGLGRFADGAFEVEQVFMRDFDEEHALLERVAGRLAGASALVSYNGRAFDMNLLQARFTIARMENPAGSLPHLDLLYSARRLWRRRILDCSLSSVERNILGIFRQGDIPGEMIPGLYFDYIRSRKGALIEPVFMHNRLDVMALAALAGIAGRIYQDPHSLLVDPTDFLSLGCALESLYSYEEAARCYRAALGFPMERECEKAALIRLGLSLKRMGRWEEAVPVWERLIGSHPKEILAYEELAKYFEHALCDYPRAESVVVRALETFTISAELHPAIRIESEIQALEYRLSRIRRKRGREET